MSHFASAQSARQVVLMDLPVEILQIILDHVFREYETVDGHRKLKTAQPRYTVGRKDDVVGGDKFMPMYYNLIPHGDPGLQAGTTSCLRVCSRMYNIGIPILYGLYEFVSYSAESFRILFTAHICPLSLHAIKSLTIGLPHSVKTMPSKYLPKYLWMLEHKMSQLRQLKITTGTGGWPRTVDPGDQVIEKHRGLLIFSAYVTLRHPTLKFAVWHEEDTILDGRLNFNHSLGSLSVIITDKRPRLRWNEDPANIFIQNDLLREAQQEIQEILNQYDIDVSDYLWDQSEYDAFVNRQLFNNLEPYDSERPDEYWDAQGQLLVYQQPLAPLPVLLTDKQKSILERRPQEVDPPSDLLLDSYKIRQTGFAGLAQPDNYRPFLYQLPPRAIDSEASAPRDLHAIPISDICRELFRYNRTPEAAAWLLPIGADIDQCLRHARNIASRSARGEEILKTSFTTAAWQVWSFHGQTL